MRALENRDVPAATALLNTYLKTFHLAPEFSEAEFAHWCLPRAGVVWAYVVEKEGRITDFLSFYSLPSSVLGNAQYSKLEVSKNRNFYDDLF